MDPIRTDVAGTGVRRCSWLPAPLRRVDDSQFRRGGNCGCNLDLLFSTARQTDLDVPGSGRKRCEVARGGVVGSRPPGRFSRVKSVCHFGVSNRLRRVVSQLLYRTILGANETGHGGCDPGLKMVRSAVCELLPGTRGSAVPMSPACKTLRRLKGFVFVH